MLAIRLLGFEIIVADELAQRQHAAVDIVHRVAAGGLAVQVRQASATAEHAADGAALGQVAALGHDQVGRRQLQRQRKLDLLVPRVVRRGNAKAALDEYKRPVAPRAARAGHIQHPGCGAAPWPARRRPGRGCSRTKGPGSRGARFRGSGASPASPPRRPARPGPAVPAAAPAKCAACAGGRLHWGAAARRGPPFKRKRKKGERGRGGKRRGSPVPPSGMQKAVSSYIRRPAHRRRRGRRRTRRRSPARQRPHGGPARPEIPGSSPTA